MILTVQDLVAAIERGHAFNYIFFWGHQARGTRVSASCMSQWSDHGFEIDGTSYPTAEHYMMAEKARLFGDEAKRTEILSAGHPAEAKKLGREVRGFDHAVWIEHRFAIVVRGNIAKFGQSDALRAYLIDTKAQVLVEASPTDRIWGIGLGATDAGANDPRQWQGLNLLGFALMRARAELTNA